MSFPLEDLGLLSSVGCKDSKSRGAGPIGKTQDKTIKHSSEESRACGGLSMSLLCPITHRAIRLFLNLVGPISVLCSCPWPPLKLIFRNQYL